VCVFDNGLFKAARPVLFFLLAKKDVAVHANDADDVQRRVQRYRVRRPNVLSDPERQNARGERRKPRFFIVGLGAHGNKGNVRHERVEAVHKRAVGRVSQNAAYCHGQKDVVIEGLLRVKGVHDNGRVQQRRAHKHVGRENNGGEIYRSKTRRAI
jgi:hypothetical protein